ncbi:MAG: sodium ion-translocating decarboxylase subunit beta [Caldisericia bacterium]|nr:sodium ion-translocating decarboxylase subunit beta [Caldisericia bacterium]
MSAFLDLIKISGIYNITWGQILMICISLVLMYLAIVKEFEPLLLLPISFGMLLANLPLAGLTSPGEPFPGILFIFRKYLLDTELLPLLIFLGLGALTDFGPLIANPWTILMGGAAQLGIFIALTIAKAIGFTVKEAGAIGIIGGADGPTAIYTTIKIAPHLLGPIAVAAYTYMSLVPLIQPPIMKLLTTKKERQVVMQQLRPVSKTEKIVFPIIVTIVVSLIFPVIAPIIGMLMLGNLFRESGVVERLKNTAANELINIVTIFLATTVGSTMDAKTFLTPKTIGIIVLGVVAFAGGTAGGVLLGKLFYWLTGGKVNPLIGSAGVSAVPMAARVSQKVGQEENPGNFLLMHAMGPNVAGVIGTAIAAGVIITILGH